MPTMFDLFTAALTGQHARLITLHTTADADLPAGLVVERFEGREGVNELFCFDIDVLSTAPYIKLKKFIGEEITLRLLQANGQRRAWHGYGTEAAWLGSDGGLTRYRLRLEPFLAFLRIRRNSRIFHHSHPQDVITQLLADYPQARFTCDITSVQTVCPVWTQYRESDLDFFTRVLAAEGLSWRFQHEQDEAVAPNAATGMSRAKHLLVIFDPHAQAPDVPGDRHLRFHGVRATDSRDAITHFAAQRRVQPNAVAVSSWDPAQLSAPAAEHTSALDNGDLPRLPLYVHAPERHYPNSDAAAHHGDRILQACELPTHTFTGAGAVRHLAAGHAFSLAQHDSYPPGQNDFTVLWAEHAAVNNLDARITQQATAIPVHIDVTDPAPTDPERLTTHALEHGTYRNRFACVHHTVPIVPLGTAQPLIPTALDPQIACVVGIEGAPITTDRDHRVLVRFPWQRPVIDPTTGAATSAPGVWVRVAEALAGPNWGSLFTPRVGDEVLINFIDNDIDHPVIVGGLYNGEDLPPYSAGVDSSANHPGTLSGMHSKGLDGQGYNQWVIDDTPHQLRMRLASSIATTELNLGHLIHQRPDSAQRGSFRGEGFELRTDAWATVRGGEGVFITTTARPGRGTSVTSTQMDAAEAITQMNAAQALSTLLGDAAAHQTARRSVGAPRGQNDLITALDSAFNSGSPAGKFAAPALLLDSPANIHWASPASTALVAGQHLHWTSQTDLHLAAAHTLASVAGGAATLFTHSGGIQAIAANGPVSLQAHTAPLEILADQAITVTSVNGNIEIKAQQKIAVQAGLSSITLEGSNITLACPGKISVKGAVHGFKGAAMGEAGLEGLPDTRVKFYDQAFVLKDKKTGEPIVGMPYRIKLPDGTFEEGVSDEQGRTHLVSSASADQLELHIKG